MKQIARGVKSSYDSDAAKSSRELTRYRELTRCRELIVVLPHGRVDRTAGSIRK